MNKIILLLAVFTASAYGSGRDLRVIESTDRSITLEFTPHYGPVQTIVSGGQQFSLQTFGRGAADESKPGAPDMRFVSVPLALPGAQGTVVDIVSADYETIEGFNQAPVPAVSAPSEQNPTGRLYTQNFSAAQEFYPANAASIANISSIHGWTVGYLKLYPVQFQPVSRTLKKCTRMVVRITYGARDPRAAASDDASLAGVLPNYGAARAWYAQPSGGMFKKPLINSVRSSGQWFKLEVTEDGIVKIDAAYLRAQGVDPASLSSIKDIKIFGGSGRPLSPNVHSVTNPDLVQCAVSYVDRNANGKFDTDDLVLFYGEGANGWAYDPGARRFSHSINPFTSSNYYLMQIVSGGTVKEMPVLASPASAPAAVTKSTGMVFFDEDKFNFNQSGQIWVGPPMSDKFLSRVVTNKLTGYAPGTPVTYRYDVFGRSNVPSSFTFEESGVAIGSADIYPMSAEDMVNPIHDYASEAAGEISVVPALSDDRSTVRMTYSAASGTSVGYINWLEILYEKQLVASADELVFTSPDADGEVEYPVSGFTTNTVLGFDVTDVQNVRTIDLKLQQQMGTFKFTDMLASGSVKKYWIGASSAYKSPKSTVKLPNTNLHGAVPGADFVIVTHHDFQSEAQRLKTHKENLPGANALRTMAVDVDSIYNEFGNGTADPTAIRNFLLYASERWQLSPKYVLFFGDASFDYKGIAGADKGWVPTFETVESNNKFRSFCLDDYFVRLDTLSPDISRMGQGRIAVRTIEEARFAVDRIIRYELNSVQDQWKNTITIVADDEWTPESQSEYDHTVQAENLATNYTPLLFEQKKIYLSDYPVVITPQGRRKPDARKAILDQVNRAGTLILNFTGHGNPTVWAHESILTLEDTKTQFTNADKLPFIVAATCDWGRFDATDVQSSAEEIMKNQSGGAIGVLSAVRAVYSTDNAQLNYAFYQYALPTDQFTQNPRLGDAFMLTKNDPAAGDSENREKYHLLGDPTIRLAVPRMAMTVDSINGISTVSGQPDTLSALQKVTVKGYVRKSDMTIDAAVNGTALVTVFDAERDKPIPDFSYPFTYVQPGAVLYKGENSIVNGKLEATFIVPKDIAYDNKQGKISVYFSSGSADGRGYTTNFMVGGTARDAANDTHGPSISVYFDAPSFKSGDVVGEEPKLIVALSDSSGINSAGTGIGHRIEAWIDNSAKSTDLTDYYKSKKDSYQEGTVEYQLPKIEAGTHSIVVKAWDVFNNPSTADASFTVASGSGLSLLNVYNIPNPVSRMTTFTFQHNQLSPVDVQIKVYSVAGRLIAQIDRFALTDRFVQIPWDLRDNDGDVLGNGMYFYRVIAKTTDGKYSSEALGKLAVVK